MYLKHPVFVKDALRRKILRRAKKVKDPGGNNYALSARPILFLRSSWRVPLRVRPFRVLLVPRRPLLFSSASHGLWESTFWQKPISQTFFFGYVINKTTKHFKQFPINSVHCWCLMFAQARHPWVWCVFVVYGTFLAAMSWLDAVLLSIFPGFMELPVSSIIGQVFTKFT